ncbi:Endospore coat-associated protein YheD [compost metagenome]
MGQDRVGILLNSSMYRGIPQRKTGQESISNYEKAARTNGFIPCFLRLGDIDPRKNYSIAYIRKGHDYARVSMPTPKVIHNRALYPELSAQRKIHSLAAQGTIIFNRNNRYGKDVIHRLLQENPSLSHCLPATVEAAPSSLSCMMAQYDDLILKPVRGSVGQGIMRLQRDSLGWCLTYPSKTKKAWITDRIDQAKLPAWLHRQIFDTPYLVQERIPLAEYDSSPLDLRVSVQRGALGAWGVTGMFLKVAPKNSFISNIAKGASVYPTQLLAKCFPSKLAADALCRVEALSLSIARYLSSRLPLLADLGMDIGLTQSGKPYFIECNGRDQRYGFRKAGLSEIWQETYNKPMAFARYLYDNGILISSLI